MRTQILFLMLLFYGITSAQNPLSIPPTIEGNNFQLTLQNGTYEFFPGQQTATMGVNGNILGPTLIMYKDSMVNIQVTNNLGQVTTIHWHGMHVSAENDGGPHIFINPGDTWNPQFPVMNRASTCWYHPHLHEHTDEHVSKGIAGLIIVRDSEEAQLDLPRTYGVDDIPLVVQTKAFDSNYQINFHDNNDDVLMVNATIDPYIDLPAQVIRLRLLNGSSQRVFNFGFDANRPFYLIATDGGLLNTPVQLTRLPLSPGERAEILIDLQGLEGQTIYLKSYASEFGNGIYGATYPGINSNMTLTGYDPNPLNGNDFNVLQINVTPQNANPVTSIPSTLSNMPDITNITIDQIRNLTFEPVTMGLNQLNGDFTINGVSFDMNTINVTIPLNNTEKWTVTNNSAIAHPFHIHAVQFMITAINGNTNIPPYAQGWKDTYLVPAGGGSIEFVIKFENFANDSIPYMYHCHMLTHEDGGMMGAFTVVDASTSVEKMDSGNLLLFPNPVEGYYVTLKLKDTADKIRSVAILDMEGRLVRYHSFHENEQNYLISIPVNQLSKGEYLIKIITDKGLIIKKMIKK